MNMPAGSLKGNLVLYPKRKGYELQINTSAINLAQLRPVQEKNLGLTGVLTASASGHGTMDDPQLTFTAQIPQLQVRQANISSIKANIDIANRQAHLDLDSHV